MAFVEVDAAAATPRAPDGYGARWLAPSPPFDVLWFTAPMPDDDPGAKMRAPKP